MDRAARDVLMGRVARDTGKTGPAMVLTGPVIARTARSAGRAVPIMARRGPATEKTVPAMVRTGPVTVRAVPVMVRTGLATVRTGPVTARTARSAVTAVRDMERASPAMGKEGPGIQRIVLLTERVAPLPR